MNIPKELLSKYHMGAKEWYITEFGDSGEHMYWHTFLCQTDHITNKLVEGSIATADCADELKYREIARQEIAKLNGETPPVVENQKTLEQRASQNEADTAFIAMMVEIDLED